MMPSSYGELESLLKSFTENTAFVVSNPREFDNPIVYASQSFFDLTGCVWFGALLRENSSLSCAELLLSRASLDWLPRTL
jgi:hypothetical protein